MDKNFKQLVIGTMYATHAKQSPTNWILQT